MLKKIANILRKNLALYFINLAKKFKKLAIFIFI